MAGKRNKKTKSTIDVDLIRSAAAGRWPEILAHVCAVDHSLLDGKHHPCPKCGGVDRFRFFADSSGGGICNQCWTSKNGDGISFVQWACSLDFVAAARKIGDYLGITYDAPARRNGHASADPAQYLSFREWSEGTRILAAQWCLKKPPIKFGALMACGARYALYRGQHNVIAIPVWGQQLANAPPVGWCLYNITGGGLPVFHKLQPPEWKKVKLTYGSQPGVIGPVEELAQAKATWKLEGPTDVLAFLSLSGHHPHHIPLTTANGAKEDPAKSPWMVGLFAAGAKSFVLHDCDRPGQEGATEVRRSDGTTRPGWAPAIAAEGVECRNVVLPFEIAPDHGPDLRDWCQLPDSDFPALLQLASETSPVAPAAAGPELLQAVDDPHYLAEWNLAKLRANGRDLKFWRDEWYVWKGEKYRKITEREFRAKITQSIRERFEKQYHEDLERWKRSPGEDPAPMVRKVTISLVTNTMQATSGMAVVSSSLENQSWISKNKERLKRKGYTSMENGILDLDAAFDEDNNNDVLLPHSPDWFSTVSLPFEFQPNAQCPRWEAFLERNLEMDPERIRILQEWAGYLLTPDTGQQKFLVLEGEGANGKSVYLAGITAMLGLDNVSNIPLEIFGDRFSRTETLGKLANISADAGEIDKAAEGYIKSFTSGDRMFFDRKGLPGINVIPSARLMIACNNRPRFSDRSSGLWRRMMLIPFNVQIPVQDRIRNMDKPWWWEESGELPGIFWWALKGLCRLQQQGCFSTSKLVEGAISEYQDDTNSARAFLSDFVIESIPNVDEKPAHIRTSLLYKLYSLWCKSAGSRPFGERQFGKEVFRRMPNVKRKRKREVGTTKSLHYVYENLEVITDKIEDHLTGDDMRLIDELEP